MRAMDTRVLEIYMKSDPNICKYYGGVVPKDFLPLKPARPSLYIVNEDTSDKAASHWIVVFLDGNEDRLAECFDPLGKEPDLGFKNYLTLQSNKYMFNNQ